MKYFIDAENVIYAYEDDGSQDELIGDKKPITAAQADAIINPPLTPEQQVSLAEQQRQALIDEAMQSISVFQLKLQAGRKLTAAETAKLNTTLDYIDAVTAVDTSTAPDISWPDRPAVQAIR